MCDRLAKRVSQVVPTKVLDLRTNHRVIKPMPAIFKRFARLGIPALCHRLGRGQPLAQLVQHHLTERVWVLRSSFEGYSNILPSSLPSPR